jgi:hypothetical protein
LRGTGGVLAARRLALLPLAACGGRSMTMTMTMTMKAMRMPTSIQPLPSTTPLATAVTRMMAMWTWTQRPSLVLSAEMEAPLRLERPVWPRVRRRGLQMI